MLNSQKFAKMSSLLPIEKHLPTILDLIDSNRVCAVQSSTGSGKTVSIGPHYILRHPNHRVLIIEPTVVACTRSAKRVKELFPQLRVSVQAGGQNDNNPNSQIIFATGGHVLIVFGQKKQFPEINLVIFDEVHTASTEYELLTKEVQYMFNHTFPKILLLTATMYNTITDSWATKLGHQIPMFESTTKLFPVEQSFSKKNYSLLIAEDQRELIRDTVLYIVEQNRNYLPGHFLVFCSGLEQITTFYDVIFSDEFNDLLSNCCVFSAHSSMPEAELDAAFSQLKPNSNQRSIILSTDIGETSVTIPHVVLVIDLGQQKLITCPIDVSILQTCKVSRFAAIQRSGRTGRTNPGKVHRMYTQAAFESLSPCYPPALQRTPLHQSILNLISFGFPPMEILGNVDPREAEKTRLCLHDLEEQKLIFPAEHGFSLSQEARTICYWPLSLPLSRVLYLVKQNKNKMIQFIGILAVTIAEVEKNMLLPYFPRRERNESRLEYLDRMDIHRLKFARFEIDSCCPLNTGIAIYLYYLNETWNLPIKKRIEWVQTHGLNNKTIGSITSLLFRLYKSKWFPTQFNLNDISGIFETEIIPLFQMRFDRCFKELETGKWVEETKDPKNVYRLNNRNLSFDPMKSSSKVLNIYSSYSLKGNYMSKLIVTYVYLRE
jgi:HrpA-like RNA helicase